MARSSLIGCSERLSVVLFTNSSHHPADEEDCSYEESSGKCEYESSSDEEDRDWYEWPNGNPLERKRFFIFENDRTLDPKYNMVGSG